MSAAIYPLNGTYLILIPLALRELLYLYVNTSDMKYKIYDYRRDIRLELVYSSRIVIYMVFDKIYMKNDDTSRVDMLKFIAISKQKMIYHEDANEKLIYLFLNPVTTLSLNYAKYPDLTTYLNESFENITNVITIPLSIEFVEALEKVYAILK